MRRDFSSAGVPQVAALAAVLLVGAGHEALHQTSLTSLAAADFWWHLRVGLGILQSHAIPHTGLYSQSASLPWMAASWLYEVAIAAGYRVMGLLILPVLAILFKLALALLVFVLAGGLRGRFWIAILLSLIAQYILIGLQPLPVYCSALALGVELVLLVRYRLTGAARDLYWLPPLFLLWANLDVQFVYGMVVLLMFAAGIAVERWIESAGIEHETPGAVFKPIAMVAAASLVATMVTPHGWNLYRLFFSQAVSAANLYFPSQQALRFRSPQDYLLLLLTMAAFLALGMRRTRDFFQIGLLVLATPLAFRAQANTWLLVLAAVAILANASQASAAQEQVAGFSWSQCAMAAGLAVAILIVVTAVFVPRDNKAILAKVAQSYPVGAADYIRDQHLAPPLFNSLPWGGFLAWYLPEYAVAIDGRTDLYGPDFNIDYAKVMNADAHYSTFAPLNGAGTLVLEKESLMGKALPSVRGFKVAYAEGVAVVLVREEQKP